jgi:hypothetical protein
MTFLNRHRWVVLAAIWSVLMIVVLTTKAVERFRRPFPLWMTEAQQWYDDAIGAGMYAVVASACVVYLYRRRRDDRCMSAGDAPVRPARWRRKVELRVVLYCLAAVLVLQFPLGVIRAIRAADDDPPPWRSSIVSLLPVGGWIFPPVGAAIVFYDRRRIRREAREDSAACPICGYDVRFSKDRCPECGTPINPNAGPDA